MFYIALDESNKFNNYQLMQGLNLMNVNDKKIYLTNIPFMFTDLKHVPHYVWRVEPEFSDDEFDFVIDTEWIYNKNDSDGSDEHNESSECCKKYYINKMILTECRLLSNLDDVKYFISIGASVHDILEIAVKNSYLTIVKYILFCYGDRISYFQIEELMKIIYVTGNIVIFKLFATKCNWLYKNTDEVICEIIRNGHLNIIQYLVQELNINVNKQDFLRIAAENGQLDIIKYLASNGFDILEHGQVILRTASERNYVSIVKYLLDNGIMLECDEKYFSPVAHAAKKGYLEIVKLLTTNGCNINKGKQEYSPLSCAIENGQLQIVKYLIENNADVDYFVLDVKDKPLCIAASYGCLAIVKYLVEKCPSINITTLQSALQIACKNDKKEIFNYLNEIIFRKTHK